MTTKTMFVNAAQHDTTTDVFKALENLLRQVAIAQGGLGKFKNVLHETAEMAQLDDPSGYVISITVDDYK